MKDSLPAVEFVCTIIIVLTPMCNNLSKLSLMQLFSAPTTESAWTLKGLKYLCSHEDTIGVKSSALPDAAAAALISTCWLVCLVILSPPVSLLSEPASSSYACCRSESSLKQACFFSKSDFMSSSLSSVRLDSLTFNLAIMLLLASRLYQNQVKNVTDSDFTRSSLSSVCSDILPFNTWADFIRSTWHDSNNSVSYLPKILCLILYPVLMKHKRRCMI